MKEVLYSILACPDCKTNLIYDESVKQFECIACRKKYEFYNDTPVFFSQYSEALKSSGENFYNKKDLPEKSGMLKKFARKITAISNISTGPTLHDSLKDEYVFHSSEDSLILNLGSGIDNIIKKNNIIDFDISPHPNTDAVGDGHYLPFLSESFDGVWMCAVIEHLKNPFQVAAEIFRVLKPGGFVLAGAPFLYHIHGSPHDYFRFTDSGLKSVFNQFKSIECGPTHTLPTGTLIEMTAQYFTLFTEQRSFIFAIRHFVKLILLPFKLLDYILKRKPRAKILSGGFVYLGTKE